MCIIEFVVKTCVVRTKGVQRLSGSVSRIFSGVGRLAFFAPLSVLAGSVVNVFFGPSP